MRGSGLCWAVHRVGRADSAGDGGPGLLRTEEFSYGVPELFAGDAKLVLGDSMLVFRFLSLYIMAQEFKDVSMPPSQFFSTARGSSEMQKLPRCAGTQVLPHLPYEGMETVCQSLQDRVHSL